MEIGKCEIADGVLAVIFDTNGVTREAADAKEM